MSQIESGRQNRIAEIPFLYNYKTGKIRSYLVKNTIKSIYLILGLVPGLASATLGDRTVASIGRIQKKSITPSQTLQFQTSQDNAVTIKEYADENGFIYAVSWQGPHHPDLATLLGRYFPEYKVAIAITLTGSPKFRQLPS